MKIDDCLLVNPNLFSTCGRVAPTTPAVKTVDKILAIVNQKQAMKALLHFCITFGCTPKTPNRYLEELSDKSEEDVVSFSVKVGIFSVLFHQVQSTKETAVSSDSGAFFSLNILIYGT